MRQVGRHGLFPCSMTDFSSVMQADGLHIPQAVIRCREFYYNNRNCAPYVALNYVAFFNVDRLAEVFNPFQADNFFL